MADKKFDLVFNASLEVGQVKSAVASLTKSLEGAGAKIPQSMATNLNRMIQSLNSELNKLEGMTDIQLDPKNAKNVGKSYEKIFQTFQSIKAALGDIHRAAGIEPEKFFPEEVAKNINKATQAMAKYKKAMEGKEKNEDYIKATKEITEADKKFKALSDKLDEAGRKRQTSALAKANLEAEKKNLEAARDKAEVEHKAAQDAQKDIQARLKAQERLGNLEEQIAKKKKDQQAAVNKAAKANEIKNDREGMKQAKGKGTDTQEYRKAVAALTESSAEVTKLQGQIDELQAEYNQLSQSATVSAEEVAEANERVKKTAEELTNAQKRLNKKQSDIDAQDTKYATATAEVNALIPDVQKAEAALEQLRQAREKLGNEFDQKTFDTLIKELEELGVVLPQTERDMDGVERALEEMAAKARGEVAKGLEEIEEATKGINQPLEQVGDKAKNVGELGEEAKRAEQDMENLKNQVLDFFSITNTIQIFKNAVRDAFETVKDLDAAMTETAVVTDFSIGDMWEKLPEYSAQATQLGTSIKSLYEATTLYYQQGLDSNQAMGVGIETMKMARIANMDAAAATEAMTAALRGFNMEINELSATRISDVYSELAAITASDTEQIAQAMSKTASIAASANMEFETTAALLAQIIETTQEAPETAGTAMKTIIARFTEVKELFSQGMLTGEDGEGEEININKIDAALKTVGISLKDFLNGSRGIDDIFLELASKWDSLDLATQRYIATTAAGSRQQSRFIAMMSNYDRTMELVTAANNSAGASQKQFNKTLESLDAKLQRLKNAWDTFTMGLANNDLIKVGVDLLTKLLETVNSLTDDLGGVVGGIAKLGIAIGALKVGKSIFNSVFDVTPLQQSVGKVNSLSKIIATALNKVGVAAKSEVAEGIDKAKASVGSFATGLSVAGAACGLFAQYLRAIGLEDFATGLEILGAVLITVGSTMGFVNSIAKTMGITVAQLGVQIWTALAPVLPVILGIAAAVGVLAFVLKKIYDKSAAGQLKAAQKDTKAAAEAAQEAADAYNNLNSALSSIADKTSSLGELTRGTHEWREAVVALNGEILDLVNTYPELSQFLTNEGGVLKIDYEKTALDKNGQEQTVDSILNSYLRKQTEAQQIYNHKQINEKRAEIELQYTKSVKSFIDTLSIIDLEKAEKESKTGSAWEDARQIVDKLAIEIAKGNVQTDESSLQEWFNRNNLEMRDYEEFDYSVFKTYGQYLISQQAAIDGLTDATIAAQMAMMKLSNVSTEATEAVTNFDENILRDAYNAQLEDAKNREITQEDYLAYAEEMGYTHEKVYKRYGKGRGRLVDEYRDENNKKVTIDEDSVRDFIVNRATNDDFTAVLQKMAEHYDSADEKEQELFTEVFANGLQELSFQTLSNFGTFQNGEFGFNEANGDAFAKAMNFDSFAHMAEILENAPEQLTSQLEQIFTEGGAEFIKARKNLVKNMTKYSTGAQKDYDVNATLLNLLEAKYKDLDVAGILTDVIGQLELTGDEEFSTAAYESLRDIMMKAEGAAEMEDALDFFNTIDFSNPIDALDKINEEIRTGTGRSKELAIAMKEANGSFLGLSSQLSTLFTSADFEEIKEDLSEIIEANGDVSAMDVFDLTKSYKSLDKVLKNNKVTAEGLAEILEQIADGTVKVDELTDTVLAAMSSFESLNSIAAKSVKFFEDFDLGIDESTVGESIVEFGDLIMENMEKGAVGNSQNFRILDTLFPGWDDDITTAEARVAEMTRLGKLLQGNGQNLRKMWSDIHAGKDYKGEDIVLSAENQKMGLSVRDTGEEIIFEGWEGKDLTSVDLVSWISDAYEVSTEMAEAMLTDFKNYSGDLADELRANDYAAGIEKAYEALHKFGDLSLIDEREIETIAKLLGVDSGTIKTDLEARGATVTQFYKDDGEIKKFEDIKQIMDVDLAGAGAQAGQKWSDSFMSAVKVGNSQGGGLVSTLNLSDLEKELKNIGITGLNADKLKQQAFEAMRDGLGQGAQMGYGKVQEILANGDAVEVTITPNMSWEEYQQQVTKLTQQNENEALATAVGNSVVQGMTEALSNVPISASIDENTLLTFRESVETTLSQVDGQISVSVSEDSQSTMDGQIAGVTDKPRETPVDIRVKSVNIGDYLGRRTVYVDLVVGNNGITGATSSASSSSSKSSSDTSAYWDSQRAEGIKNAPHAETSLVSEEGPELIQKASGGAYLTGMEGPEIANIEKGDTVYTAEETKNILKSRNHNVIPRYASGYGYGSAYSGGKNVGSKSDDDKEDWVNSFDKLYNLVREIDEELRQRERLERRYEKLLESVDLTADKLFDNAVEQLKQLEKEKLLQKELQEARRQQISQYQSENSDLMKYAKIVQNERGEDVLRIHWDQINLVEDPEQGQRIEDYVSQLEEWMDGLNDIEDELNDIEDRIEEVKELGKDEYLDLENAIKDAVAFAYQEEIDKLSEINESINDTNTQLIDAISKQVNRIRQQRENENTERELQEKQRQLQYLQQDTSGANAMEILQLQKEIAEGQQDYTDTLIDQKISELQEQNDEAATQREQQITLMQAQLDHLIQSGEIWDEVYSLMDEGLDPEAGLVRGSRLEQLLKSADGFDGMSKVQQMDWLKELQQQAAQAVTYMRLTTEKLDTSIELNRQNYFGATTPEPEYNGSGSSGSGGSSGGSSGGGSSGGSSSSYTKNPGYSSSQIMELQRKAGISVDGIWGPQTAAAYDRGVRPDTKNDAYLSDGQKVSNDHQWKIYTPGGSYITTYTGTFSDLWKNFPSSSYKYVQVYKKGGLVDQTGPAWLDGTKSRPEMVLNARDTQNFIQLKDILASIMERGSTSNTSTENNGDITYDIDINVESIGSDYDVEQVANKVKSMIGENARYRNNNTVSLAR